MTHNSNLENHYRLTEIEVGDLVEIYPSPLNENFGIMLTKLHIHTKQPTGQTCIFPPKATYRGVVIGMVERKTKYMMGLSAEGWITRKGYQIFSGDALLEWDDGSPNCFCRLLMKANGVKMIEEEEDKTQ